MSSCEISSHEISAALRSNLLCGLGKEPRKGSHASGNQQALA